MHKFMSAVGFSDCYTKRQLDEIIKRVLSNPNEETVVTDSRKRKIFQVNKRFSSRFGVSVVGEIDNRGFHNVLFTFPFVDGCYTTQEDEIQLQKFAEKDAYAGISDDYNIGVSLIFYVQNLTHLIDALVKFPSLEYNKVVLSALSTEGEILFGIEKNEYQLQKETEGKSSRNYLIQEAKNGDMDAIENLTLEDIDLYSDVSRRAREEDIFSIVDTTFMPFGVESDQYSILAQIESVQKYNNEETDESIYIMELRCNDINMSLAINSKDLYGEPEVGRRFKGTIWLQGNLPVEQV